MKKLFSMVNTYLNHAPAIIMTCEPQPLYYPKVYNMPLARA